MNKFWTKIKSWFKPKTAQKKPIPQPKLMPAKLEVSNYRPINHKRYKKLIKKLTKQALISQQKQIKKGKKPSPNWKGWDE